MFYKLHLNDLELNCLVLKRDFTKPKNLGKPEHYLFDIGKKAYISSLFPTDKPFVYGIDFKNLGKDIYAIVKICQDNQTIEVLEKGQNKFLKSFNACLDNNTSMVNKSIYLNKAGKQ